MKICIVSGSYPPMNDGVGGYSRELFFALQALARGVELTLLTTRTEVSQEDESSGVQGLVDSWQLCEVLRVLRALVRQKPDIVHIQYPALGYGRQVAINLLPGILRFLLPQTRIVVTLHEFPVLTWKGQLRLLVAARPAHSVIIVEKSYERYIRRFLPRKAIFTVPVGANIATAVDVLQCDRAGTRARLGVRDESVLICNFGVVRARKGLEFLLEAMADRRIRNTGAKLLLIGPIDEKYYHKILQPLIQRLQVEEQLLFVGKQSPEEIACMFRTSDFCILPFEDGVSTKRGSFMAAMQYGMPTITTIPHELPFGLSDDENVMLVRHGAHDDLVRSMLYLAEHPERRKHLGEALRKLRDGYSWTTVAERTMNVYRSVLKER